MFKNIKKRRQEGFTIIEVMIVLAIAGLIMVVVLIAVPQLQRNQRNEARRATLARVVAEISNYAGNNNGKIPEDMTELGTAGVNNSPGTGFVGRYLDDINIEDPSTGEPFSISFDSTAGTNILAPTLPNEPQGIMRYAVLRSCDGEKLASGNNRNFALWTELEGGAIYCLDNS